jgi:hypothetical protein
MTKGMFQFTYDLNMGFLNPYLDKLKSVWDIDWRYFFHSQNNVNAFLEKGFGTEDPIFKSNYNII